MPQTDNGSPIVQVSGRDAIKKEFQKIGFVFNSDTTAMCNKDNVQIGLLDRGSLWQVSTKVWGDNIQDIYENCIAVIWGRDKAWSNLIYLDNAMEMPGSVFKSPQIQAFVQDGKLVMHIFLSK